MDNQAFAPVTMCMSKVTLAAGTTTTLSTTGTTTYAIRGKAYTKSAITNGATPTTDWATGNAFLPVKANNGSVFMVGLDHSGNLKCIQGTVTPLDGIVSSNLFITAPQFGGLGPSGNATTDNDFCPIGYLVIQAGTTADATTGWIFGTSNMSSVTGITYTFVDVIGMPDRPQVS
jgi:hypothetical protein